MPNVHLPLSGPVLQDISPFRNSWFSFLTVNMGRSSAPETEEAALEVASYGRQLGRINEALLAIIESDPERKLTKEQDIAIQDFKALLREIERAKAEAQARPKSRSMFERWFV